MVVHLQGVDSWVIGRGVADWTRVTVQRRGKEFSNVYSSP